MPLEGRFKNTRKKIHNLSLRFKSLFQTLYKIFESGDLSHNLRKFSGSKRRELRASGESMKGKCKNLYNYEKV